jgi:hypothetical protein
MDKKRLPYLMIVMLIIATFLLGACQQATEAPVEPVATEAPCSNLKNPAPRLQNLKNLLSDHRNTPLKCFLCHPSMFRTSSAAARLWHRH